MKKIVIGVFLISILLFSGCLSKNKTEYEVCMDDCQGYGTYTNKNPRFDSCHLTCQELALLEQSDNKGEN